jgi:hypothetical protein
MKAFKAIAMVAAISTMSGCVVAPTRGDYRDRDQQHYERRPQDRDHSYRHDDNGRLNDGDHAGGTRTPD